MEMETSPRVGVLHLEHFRLLLGHGRPSQLGRPSRRLHRRYSSWRIVFFFIKLELLKSVVCRCSKANSHNNLTGQNAVGVSTGSRWLPGASAPPADPDSVVNSNRNISLWPPYLADADIICSSCFFLLSSFFLIFSSPNLSSRRLDVYHTFLHMVWP